MLDALLNQEAGETEWRYKSNCFMKGKNGNNGNKSKRKNVDDDEPPTFSNHPLISMEDIFAPEDIISTPPLLNSDDWSFDTSPDAVDSNTSAPLHHYFQLADPDVYLKTQQVEGKDESTFHQLNTAAYYHDMEPPSSSSKIDQLSDHNYSHRCSDVDTKAHGETCSLIGGSSSSSGGGGLLVDVMTSADDKSCASSTCDLTRGPYMGGLDDISMNDLFQHDSLYMPPSCSSISSSVSTACSSPHEVATSSSPHEVATSSSPHEVATSSSPHEVAPPTSSNDKEAVPVVKHQEYAKKRRRNNEACRESRKKKKSERVENEKLVGELTDDNAQLRLQIKKLEAERDEVRRILMEKITKNAATSSSSS